MKTTRNKLKSLLIASLLFFYGAVKAQDILLLKTGEEFKVKVSEVTDYQVKYKLSNDLNGPMRVLYRTEIFSIRYENGTKELFNNPAPSASNPSSVTQHFQDRQYGEQPEKKRNQFDEDTSDFAKKKKKNFSGPRVGVTYVTPGTIADYLEYKNKGPVLAQFGWQFEGRLFTTEDGTSGLIEFVPLIGGINQGLFLPSASFLIGLRGGSNKSWEFAMGPNFGIKPNYDKELGAYCGLVVALGTSFKKGNVWFPVNLVFVPSIGSVETVKDPNTGISSDQKFETGWKIGLVVGFNSRRR